MSRSLNKIEVALSLSIKQFSGAVKKVDRGFMNMIRSGQAYRKTLNNLNGASNQLRTTLVSFAGILGGGALFGAAARSAFGFNQTVEQSRIGIAALVRTFEGVDMEESFSVAADIQQRLQIAGLKTTATYQDLLRALQEGIGPALRENFDPKQIVSFTTSMTQAAAALSLPMDQLGQELRAILDGTIDRNARIAKALSIDNDMVKGWKAAGTLFEELEKKLFAFSAAGDQAAKTFGGAFSNMIDAIQLALGSGTRKMFDATTKAILRMTKAIVTIDESANTFTFNEKITAAIDDIDTKISAFLESLTGADMAAALENIVKTAGAIIDVLGNFAGAVTLVANMLGPFAPVLAKVAGNFLLFSGALKILSFAFLEPFRQLKALNAMLVVSSGGGLVAWSGAAVTAAFSTNVLTLAFGSLKGALGVLSGVLIAAQAGYMFGTWLNQFDLVQKAGNKMAAGLTKGWLMAKKAWTWLTRGDTAAVQREIEEAERIYAEMYAEIGQEAKQSATVQKKAQDDVGANAKRAAGKQEQVTGDALKSMSKKYKKFFTELKKLQGKIDSLALDVRTDRLDFSQEEFDLEVKLHGDKAGEQMLMDRISDLKLLAESAGGAGVKGWKEQVSLLEQAKGLVLSMNTDVEKVSNADVKAAKEKLRLAERAVQVHNVSSKRSAYKEALADYRKLVKEQKEGPSEEAKQEAVRRKLEEVRSINKEILAVKEAQIEALEKQATSRYASMEDMTNKSGFADLEAGMDDADKKWMDHWTAMRFKAEKDIDAVEKRLQNMKDKTITVTIVEKVAKVYGGLVRAAKAYAIGGRVTGPGGIDKVSAWLTKDEVVIKEPSVRAAGLRAALAFNAGNWGVVVEELQKRFALKMNFGGLVGALPLPAIPVVSMQTGGQIGAMPGGDSVTINLFDHVINEQATLIAPTKNDYEVFERIQRRNRRLSST